MSFRRLSQAGDIVNGALRIRHGFFASRRKRQRNGIEKLGVSKEELGLTVGAFVFRLARVGAAMKFEVELADPNGRILGVGFRFFKKLDRLFLLDLRQAVEVSCPARFFQHLDAGAAPSVPPAEYQQRPCRTIEFPEVLDTLHELTGSGIRVVGVRRWEVCKDARAIDSLPEEGMVRKLVELIPGDFLSQKVFDPGLVA